MARQWTSAQMRAIETRGKTLLVSAAAGSGKTSTLTERIIRSVTDEKIRADISRLLVVTFTRASAADMKRKISEALSAAIAEHPTDRHLAKQMMLLESAKISTIDSFYYDLVKSHASLLSLPSDLRIADGSEIAVLYQSEMEKLIDDMYDREPSFPDFMEHFTSIGNAGNATEIFLSVYQSVLSYQEGLALLPKFSASLREAAGKDFLDTPYGQTAKRETLAALDYAMSVLEHATSYMESSGDQKLILNYLPAFLGDLSAVTSAKKAILENSYETVRQILTGYRPISLKSVKNPDNTIMQYRALRDHIKKTIPAIGKKYFSFPAEDISLLMKQTADVTDMLYRLLTAFDRRVNQEKADNHICDFSDIRRYALALTVKENGEPTELALLYREQFDEIYIDEYQDVDEVQDLIFRAISRPDNRFMVGDIKQSIYGFRGADPSVFAEYKKTFPLITAEPSSETKASIFMSDNFRCDKSIIDFSNLIFSYLFTNCGENIGYTKDDDLIYAKTSDAPCQKVTLALVGKEEAPSPSPLKSEYDEAVYIAEEILRLVKNEKKADGTSILWEDITVMMRARSGFAVFKEVFASMGIPYQSEEETDFFENPDVLLLLALLSTVDNPRRDISLAGTLRSPFFDFSMDELIAIRKSADESHSLYDALCEMSDREGALAQKCTDFLHFLSKWRQNAKHLSASKLLQKLYRELSVLSLFGSKKENLIQLYEYARHYESGDFKGLDRFVSYINELIARKTKLDIGSGGSGTSAVTLMTVHHSKGLEFPVCFLYGCGKRFSNSSRINLQFDATLGVGMKLHDPSGFGFYDTPVRRAILDRRAALEQEEEMRVLYVALTRARERLYLTAAVKKPDVARSKAEGLALFSSSYSVLASSCFLDWILAALHGKDTSDILSVIEVPKIHSLPQKGVSWETRERKPEPPSADPALTSLFSEHFAFEYPYQHISELPAKLSVSGLYPALLDEPEEPVYHEDSFLLPESLTTTKHAGAAERGTATHTVLQFCHFSFVKQYGIREEIERLCEHRFIDRSMADIVNIRDLERFFDSKLFDRIQKARQVWREQRFHILLPASDFTEDPDKKILLQNETIAVQGVIDIFFEEENGNIVLVDYKTDHLTPEERKDPEKARQLLIARHGEQLTYYAKAITLMCGKAPAETLIYSLPLGNTIAL